MELLLAREIRLQAISQNLTFRSFRKLGGTLFGILIIRFLLFRVLY